MMGGGFNSIVSGARTAAFVEFARRQPEIRGCDGAAEEV